MQNKASISLKDLLMAVRQELHLAFDSSYWVRAEISEIRENSNGHCYLELIEKDSSEKLIVAKTKAAIWADTYRLLDPYFRQETGQKLNVGLKILVEVSVNFHEVYGFSCVVRDIDPTFTLGDLAKKRQETTKKLKEDGVWDMNKSLDLPELSNRIAVISSPSAAGYGDFCDQLLSNKKGYKFYVKLFPAIMQGEAAVDSIIDALDAVFSNAACFDAVALIRGGGATTDMLAFDEYDLAVHCAQFPLPLITGIGHDRDESVVDMVAHSRCKTPTAVAAFLIDKAFESEENLNLLQRKILEKTTLLISEENKCLRDKAVSFSRQVNTLLQEEKFRTNKLSSLFSQKINTVLNTKKQNLSENQSNLKRVCHQLLTKERHKMELFTKTLSLVSPENILKKGYSLTVKEGKIVRSASQLDIGDTIKTVFYDGEKQSVIIKK